MSKEMSAMLKMKAAKVAETMDAVNAKIGKSITTETFSKLEDAMKKAVKAYNLQVRDELFIEVHGMQHPFEELARRYTYTGIKASKVLYKGTLVKYVQEPVGLEIDLLDYCEYCKKTLGEFVDTRWSAMIEVAARFLTKRNAFLLGVKEDALEDIDALYRLSNEAKAVTLNCENPYTQTQLTKMLQMVIDNILFVPGDKNPKVNKYQLAKYDVFYFSNLYSDGVKDRTPDSEDEDKPVTKRVGLKVKSPKALRWIIFSMLHRLVCDMVYTVDYRGIAPRPKKTDKNDADKPEATPAPEAEAKTEGDKPEEAKAEGKAA